MSILYVFFAVAVGWLIFQAVKRTWPKNEKVQVISIRISLYGLIGVLAAMYLILEFSLWSFTQIWYLPMLTMLTFAELQLYRYLMTPTQVDGALSAAGKKRRESRRNATAFLLVALLAISIWMLVGYFSPGSLGTLNL